MIMAKMPIAGIAADEAGKLPALMMLRRRSNQMILQFRNDSRVQYHPSYAEMVRNTRLESLRTLDEMFTTLLANETLPASDRAYYQKELRKVRASISGLQRSANVA